MAALVASLGAEARMSDLFSGAQPKTGRNHPATSHAAAEKVRPQLPSIRARVLDKLMAAGEAGLTDDELALELPDIIENSLRSSRVGLADELWILDSGQRRENLRGNECIAWVHRQFHPSAPEMRAGADKGQERAKIRALREEAAEIAAKLPPEIAQLKKEGRALIASYLERAAVVMAALSQVRD